MKKIMLVICSFLFLSIGNLKAESYVTWGQTEVLADGHSGITNKGTSYTCLDLGGTSETLSYDIYSVNISTGLTTNLASWHNSTNCGLTDENFNIREGSLFDSTTGQLTAVQNVAGTSRKVVDALNNGTLLQTLPTPTMLNSNQSFSSVGYAPLGVSKILDTNGRRIISKSENGEIHIGENSLVTVESEGVQQLYATDGSGNQIDINIKSGTNLLIDGTNITSLVGSNSSAISTLQQDLSGSVALSSALAALPNSSPDAFYTCGLGTGIHDSSSALSAGCASDFSNYAFVDNMPKIFQTASFNIGSSFLMNGEPDISEARDMSIKAGITFKFGSVKPTSVADKNNYMLENKIDAVMQENRKLKAQLKEENNLIRQENDLLKTQIAEINSQLRALNMIAMN